MLVPEGGRLGEHRQQICMQTVDLAALWGSLTWIPVVCLQKRDHRRKQPRTAGVNVRTLKSDLAGLEKPLID